MELEWKTVKRKVAELVPYELNPRKISDKEQKDLQNSIIKFGLVEIPVIDVDGTIVAGHQRLTILMMLGNGNDTIDVRIPNRKLTAEELKEYNIRSNRHNGVFDQVILENKFEFQELIMWGFGASELPKSMIYDKNQLGEGKTVKQNVKIGFSYSIEFENEYQLGEFNDLLTKLAGTYPEELICNRLLKYLQKNG